MTEPRVVLREPVPGDAPALGRMHHQAWVDTYGPLLPAGWFDQPEHGPGERVALWERVLGEPLPDGARRIAAFDTGDVPVGWSVAGPTRAREDVDPVRAHEVWGLYVARSRLGTGLGQHLMDWAAGDLPAELWTAEGNERAIAFYRRNGFALDGAAVQGRGFPLAELRMVR